MIGVIALTLGSLMLLWLFRTLSSLNRNVAAAKKSGIPYKIAPISGIAGFLWTGIHDPILGFLKSLPFSRNWLWPMLVEPHRSWNYAHELRDALGDLFLIVSPGQIYLFSSNAETIMQMMTRRTDFVKPVEIYEIVDFYGSNILTTEGPTWKRHRKIMAPTFSEKSNAMVWKESLRQTEGMLGFWAKLDNNPPTNMTVKDVAKATALMTLHVISGAGFGVRQVWDADHEEQLGINVVPGFNTAKLNGAHTLAFKDSLYVLLENVIWMAILPVWLLKQSPFSFHKKLMQAFIECGDYFKELSEYKSKQLGAGVSAETGTMDLMAPLVKASEIDPNDSKDAYLTKQEVIGNSWIILFAGHESTGNTTHFALSFLAIALDSQAKLQADIDKILGTRAMAEWTYESDMGRLYQSMVGATMNEALRLCPPIIDIPKIVRETPKSLNWDGKTVTVPPHTMIHLSACSVGRNPRYWPHSPSKVSSRNHDLDDFVPERWLRTSKKVNGETASSSLDSDNPDDRKNAFFESGDGLFVPPKGAFVPFSEGARSCPGKRFAQVEIMAVLAVIFKTYSVELDVREWASDEEIKAMGKAMRRNVYEKAMAKARRMVRESETIIALKMHGKVPVRFVERGKERFMSCFV